VQKQGPELAGRDGKSCDELTGKDRGSVNVRAAFVGRGKSVSVKGLAVTVRKVRSGATLTGGLHPSGAGKRCKS
jgi:hypothetical protein